MGQAELNLNLGIHNTIITTWQCYLSKPSYCKLVEESDTVRNYFDKKADLKTNNIDSQFVTLDRHHFDLGESFEVGFVVLVLIETFNCIQYTIQTML